MLIVIVYERMQMNMVLRETNRRLLILANEGASFHVLIDDHFVRTDVELR